jgi:peptide/nickel transport system permease protein
MMLKYILRRIWQMIPTVIGVVLLTFVLFNIAGGDLAAKALGKRVSPQKLEDFDVQRGLNLPLFVGTRATTRAYQDHNFEDGPGRWNSWTNAAYRVESKTVTIDAGGEVNPLAFIPEGEDEFVWTVVSKGKGTLAGQVIESDTFKRFKVRFDPHMESPGFVTGDHELEIRSLKLRRANSNPFKSQLSFYVTQLSKGDLGFSEEFKQPVSSLLLQGVGPSLSLTVPIFIIGLIVSISLSLLCAFFRDTWVDRSLVIISVALMSINYLVYIVAAQYWLGFRKGLFPVWGYESWQYLALPVLIGVVSGLGSSIRFYRTIMLDEMYKDYIRTAFAKGVSKFRVLFVHVLKNAMIPIITNVVMAIPFLYTGSLLLESFFGIPGLGYLSISAINSSDIDVVRAVVLIGALLFVVANLLTDICYALADPRVKLK